MRQVLLTTLVLAGALLACQKEEAPLTDPAPVATPAAPVAEAPTAPAASVATETAKPTTPTYNVTQPVATTTGTTVGGVFAPAGIGGGTKPAAQPTATSTGASAALAPTGTAKPTATAAATAAPTTTAVAVATPTATAATSAKPPKPSLFAVGVNPATGSAKGTDNKGSTGDAAHRNRTTHAPTRPGAARK